MLRDLGAMLCGDGRLNVRWECDVSYVVSLVKVVVVDVDVLFDHVEDIVPRSCYDPHYGPVTGL